MWMPMSVPCAALNASSASDSATGSSNEPV
jgi:hypothetical protein